MITVYTKNRCAACTATKKTLSKLNKKFIEVNVSEHPEILEQLKKEGWVSLPVVKTRLKEWSGFNPDLLSEA